MRRYFFGEWIESKEPLTVADVQQLCDLADKARVKMADYPVDKVLALLERVGETWKNPKYPGRVKLLKELPESTRFSKAMIEKGMDEIAWVCNSGLLRKKCGFQYGLSF